MNQFLQNIIFFYILKNPSLAERCKGEFFDIAYLKVLFEILKPFVLEYKECPTLMQAADLVQVAGKDQIISKDILDTVYSHEDKLSQYEESWLDDNTKAWLTWSNTVNGLKKTIAYVKTVSNDVNFQNFQEINDKVKTVFNSETALSFDDDAGCDFFDPEQHKSKKIEHFSSGYEFIDLCGDGGYWLGSLWCLMGAPKIGKSTWLGNLAARSVTNGNNSAYVTLELQEAIINQRIGANLFGISTYDYKDYAEDTAKLAAKMKEYFSSLLIKPGALWIKEFPTSAASVADIEAALLKRETALSTEAKPFKFKTVFVDYINIIKNSKNPNSENTYLKIKNIAEDLRAMAQRNQWCVITATQTNRSQADSNDVSYQSISESYALIATVDMLFGIIRDIAMRANGEYYLKIVANRATIHMNERKRFTEENAYMRINEDKAAPIIDDNDILTKFPMQSKGLQTAKPNLDDAKVLSPADLSKTETNLDSLF